MYCRCVCKSLQIKQLKPASQGQTTETNTTHNNMHVGTMHLYMHMQHTPVRFCYIWKFKTKEYNRHSNIKETLKPRLKTYLETIYSILSHQKRTCSLGNAGPAAHTTLRGVASFWEKNPGGRIWGFCEILVILFRPSNGPTKRSFVGGLYIVYLFAEFFSNSK